MRIDDDLKLTFRDVLIRPKRSTLKSRSEVSLSRVFKFKHTEREWKGIPVVAANMDTTGTFEVASELQKVAGFDKTRMMVVGRAETRPLVPNDSREDRRRNRRVEISILQGKAKESDPIDIR
jgi:IMP dehydrogenase/GMP reductase